MNDLNYSALKETLSANNQQYLVINNPVTNKPLKIKIETFIDIFGGDLVITADNGLSVVGSATELGGALTKATDIDFNSFNLSFSNVPAGSGTESALVIDGSGNIKSYALSSLAGWGLTGNSGTTAGTNFIGTSDDIDVVFKRNSIEKLRILTSSVTIVDNVGIGGPTIDARLHVKGAGGTTYAFKVEDSSANGRFHIKNNGEVNINGGAGINSTLSVVQRAGINSIFDIYNSDFSKHYIRCSDTGLAAGLVYIGNSTIEVDAYGSAVGIGVSSNSSVRLRVKGTSAAADIIAFTPSAGNGGMYIKDVTNNPYLYLQDSSAATKVKLDTSGDSYLNGGKVSMTALPTSNAGLSTGDLYVDTAANILANSDKVVGWKV